MINCKFLGDNCKCQVTGYNYPPTMTSVMGYCMVVVDKLEECDWFTEEVE